MKEEGKDFKNNLRTVFLCIGLLGLLGAWASHRYLKTHRTFVVFKVFLVRDVNGVLVKKDIEFYVKGHKQQCTPGLYWP